MSLLTLLRRAARAILPVTPKPPARGRSVFVGRSAAHVRTEVLSSAVVVAPQSVTVVLQPEAIYVQTKPRKSAISI